MWWVRLFAYLSSSRGYALVEDEPSGLHGPFPLCHDEPET